MCGFTVLNITCSAHLQLFRQLHVQMEAQHRFLGCACWYLCSRFQFIQSFHELSAKKGIILLLMLQVLLGLIQYKQKHIICGCKLKLRAIFPPFLFHLVADVTPSHTILPFPRFLSSSTLLPPARAAQRFIFFPRHTFNASRKEARPARRRIQ